MVAHLEQSIYNISNVSQEGGLAGEKFRQATGSDIKM